MKGLKLSVVASLGVGSYYLFRKCELPTLEGEPYRQLPIPRYLQHPNKHFLTKILSDRNNWDHRTVRCKEQSQQGFQVEVLKKSPTLEEFSTRTTKTSVSKAHHFTITCQTTLFQNEWTYSPSYL